MISLFQIVFIVAFAEALIYGLTSILKAVVVILGLCNCGSKSRRSRAKSHSSKMTTSLADNSAVNSNRYSKRTIGNNCETNNLVAMSKKNDTIILASEQEREQMEMNRLHGEHAYLAATGIEFGGNNTDLNLNPAAHYEFDDSISSSLNDSYTDSGWNTGYTDFGDSCNSSFDPFVGL